MSILIKGMTMPETCYECPCGDNVFCECMATKVRTSYHRDEYGYPDGERQEWCPLVEIPPHGRLIDGDEARRAANLEIDFAFVAKSKVRAAMAVAAIIADAPTIIEAEEAEL